METPSDRHRTQTQEVKQLIDSDRAKLVIAVEDLFTSFGVSPARIRIRKEFHGSYYMTHPLFPDPIFPLEDEDLDIPALPKLVFTFKRRRYCVVIGVWKDAEPEG